MAKLCLIVLTSLFWLNSLYADSSMLEIDLTADFKCQGQWGSEVGQVQFVGFKPSTAESDVFDRHKRTVRLINVKRKKIENKSANCLFLASHYKCSWDKRGEVLLDLASPTVKSLGGRASEVVVSGELKAQMFHAPKKVTCHFGSQKRIPVK